METVEQSVSAKESRKNFKRSFFRLLLTIAGQNIIVYGVNLLDNVMIGRYSELALSGVFLVNQIQFLLQMIVGGISDGTVVIASRFWGEKKIEDIKKVSATAMRVAVIISFLFMFAALLFPTEILGIFADKPNVIAEGEKYFVIVCLSYVFFAVTQTLLGMLRSVECTIIGFIDSCVALILNFILNYMLIFGKCGFPELGIEGAAIATLTARVGEFLVVLVYLAFFEKKLHVKFSDFLHSSREITKKFVKVSFPVVISGAIWGVAMGLQTAILGRLTEPVISANSIASTVFQIMTVFTYGSATAASIMIAKTLGESKNIPQNTLKKEIIYRSRWLQGLFILLGILTGLGIFFFRNFIIGFYDISPETSDLARTFMLILSITVVGTSYQMPCHTGIVRGGGDTSFVFYLDIISMWGVILPVSFLAAFVFKLSPAAIFFCLKSDQIYKCVIAAIKVNRYKWIKNI